MGPLPRCIRSSSAQMLKKIPADVGMSTMYDAREAAPAKATMNLNDVQDVVSYVWSNGCRYPWEVEMASSNKVVAPSRQCTPMPSHKTNKPFKEPIMFYLLFQSPSN